MTMDRENQMLSQTYTQIAAMTMDSENQILSQTYTQIHTYTHTRVRLKQMKKQCCDHEGQQKGPKHRYTHPYYTHICTGAAEINEEAVPRVASYVWHDQTSFHFMRTKIVGLAWLVLKCVAISILILS